MARKRRGQFPKPRQEDGQWKITYREYLESGAKKRTKCLGRVDQLSFAEARKAAQKFLDPINEVAPGSEFSDRTMKHLVDHWRAVEKSNLKRSTQLSYEWAIKRIEPAFARASLKDITKPDIQAFLVSASRELAPFSVHDLRAHLSGLMNISEELGWTIGNPTKGHIRLPPAVRSRVRVRQKVVLHPEQLWLLVAALRPPYSTAVVVAAFTGLRVGEIAALRWNDVSGINLTIDEALYRGELATPKGYRAVRVTGMGPRAVAAIEELRSLSQHTDPEDFIFGFRRGRAPELSGAAARVIHPVCRRIGIPIISWHDLRHTHATWGRRAGVSPELMRDQLGHASIQTTLGIYSHMAAIDNMAAVAVEGFANSHPGCATRN